MLQFSRRNDLQNTGIDPAIENRRIVWTFFEAAGRKVACENSENKIGRYRLSLVSLQIAGWLSAENFEK